MMASQTSKVLEAVAQAETDARDPFATAFQHSNPKVQWIVAQLDANQLLVEPVRQFVSRKIAEMTQAQLVALYGQEEFDRMVAAEKQKMA